MKSKMKKYLAVTTKTLSVVIILSFISVILTSCGGLEDIGSYLSYKIRLKLGAEYQEELLVEKEKGEEIMLPKPRLDSEVSLEKALNERRSIRSFSEKKLTLEEISQLLWSAQGITRETTGFRTSPSAGALYPLEIYLIKEDGLFHYLPDGHKLIRLSSDDLRPKLLRGVLFQGFIAEAPVVIIITAIYERTTIKYGERGIRYVHIEAGHGCQNILLQATAMELGSVPVGAFDDDYVRNLVGLPENYVPLYVVPVGYPR